MQSMSAPSLHVDIEGFLAPLRDANALTAAVMVTSVDGRATIAGRVGELTGDADQQVLLGAREAAAAVIVGASTIAAEGYDRLLDDQARARRQARGMTPEPELVSVSRSGPPPPELMADLRGRHPDALLICEGGPRLLGLMVSEHLIDQLVLGISPLLVGDDSQKRLLEIAQPLGIELELLGLALSGDHLFLRYGILR
jgi:riboflavin biosynthesis pyrimidine reductase